MRRAELGSLGGAERGGEQGAPLTGGGGGWRVWSAADRDQTGPRLGARRRSLVSSVLTAATWGPSSRPLAAPTSFQTWSSFCSPLPCNYLTSQFSIMDVQVFWDEKNATEWMRKDASCRRS